MTEIVQPILSKCEICHQNNPDTSRRVVLRVTKTHLPGDYWQIDFAKLSHKEGYRYVLALSDAFQGLPKTYPCHTNMKRRGESFAESHYQIMSCFSLKI